MLQGMQIQRHTAALNMRMPTSQPMAGGRCVPLCTWDCRSSPLPKLQFSLCFDMPSTLSYIPVQAEAVQQHLAGLQQPLQVEVVICSPLTRTLETAVGIFGTTEWTDDMQGTPLMLQQPSRPVRVSHQEGVHTSLPTLLLLAAFLFKAWTGL